jgi:hypothetical protein
MTQEIDVVEVIRFLRPNGGWNQVGLEYEGIEFVDCEPFTKEEFVRGCKDFAKNKAKEAQDLATAKTALLDRLGITADEAKLLLA